MTEVLPVPKVDLIEIEGKDVVVNMDHVVRSLSHRATETFSCNGVAAEYELVISLARKRVEDTPRISLEIAPFRRPVRNGDADLSIGKYRNDRM